jgi:hypothetical protein
VLDDLLELYPGEMHHGSDEASESLGVRKVVGVRVPEVPKQISR